MRTKGVFIGPEKSVFHPNGDQILCTDIRQQSAPTGRQGDVRFREYVMLDSAGKTLACANPGYAEGDDPAVVGWPIYRMPRVDHADIQMDGKAYILTMQNSQNYTLKDSAGYTVVQIMHRGLAGGWNIDTDECFAPEILCGLFAFCRYIEQENELLID